MNQNLLKIYALIMLECRLPLEDASTLFKIDSKLLEKNLTDPNIVSSLIADGIKYLIYYEAFDTYDDLEKRQFKANLYLRKLFKIFKEENKETRKEKLNQFIMDISGPNLNFLSYRNPNKSYSPEEKRKILIFQLKFALSNQILHERFGIHHNTIKMATNELTEENLKRRLISLNEFLQSQYWKLRKR